MPYISKDRRADLHTGEMPETAGELNYLLTFAVNEYINAHGINYQVFNDALGALEGAKMELYRRLVGFYEDRKIEENGDVYTIQVGYKEIK